MEKHHTDMSVEEVKHEMLLWEARYLMRHGWRPGCDDARARYQDGYTWYDEKSQGPFTQRVAVDTQMERDADPLKQRFFDLGVQHSKCSRSIENKKRVGETASAETTRLKLIEAEMLSPQRATR